MVYHAHSPATAAELVATTNVMTTHDRKLFVVQCTLGNLCINGSFNTHIADAAGAALLNWLIARTAQFQHIGC